MTKLPTLSGRELIVLLQKAGFKVIGQRGQHVSLRKGDRRLIIPYNETLAEQTLLNIIDQADLDAKDILNLLQQKSAKKEVVEEEPEDVTTEEDEPVPIIAMGFGRESWYGSTWAFPVALLRILAGLLFLIFALQKAPWADFGWYPDLVRNNIANPSFDWYASFYQSTVQPNLSAFGWISFSMELFVALSLILGILTVLGGIIGAGHVAWFAMGALYWPHEWEWAYIFWVAICLVAASTRAGRCFGLDFKVLPWLEQRQNQWWANLLLKFV